jgi:hypothetical protein
VRPPDSRGAGARQGQAARHHPPSADPEPVARYKSARPTTYGRRGSVVKLYDFGILIIAALVASAIAAAILTQVHH